MEISCYNTFMNKNEMFSNNLREIRMKKGYTQTQLAKLSGLSRRTIVHYENYVKDPVFEKVKVIADALGVSIDDLFGMSSSKKKKKDEDISFKLMKKLRIVEKLPTRDQNTIFSLINALAEKNKLKQKK